MNYDDYSFSIEIPTFEENLTIMENSDSKMKDILLDLTRLKDQFIEDWEGKDLNAILTKFNQLTTSMDGEREKLAGYTAALKKICAEIIRQDLELVKDCTDN